MRFYLVLVLCMTILSEETVLSDNENHDNTNNIQSPTLRQKLKDVITAEKVELSTASTTDYNMGDNNDEFHNNYNRHYAGPSELQGAVPNGNNHCGGAINLDDYIDSGGSYYDGAMTKRLADDILSCMAPYTGSYSGTGLGGGPNLKGSWFRITGTGNTLMASTCGDATNYDTVIQVFQGECDSLTCVTQNNNDPSCETIAGRSTVTFPTQQGTAYAILVYGYAGDFGNFELLLETAATPTMSPNVSPRALPPTLPPTNFNDRCRSAQILDSGADITNGTTTEIVGRNSFSSCGYATQSTSGQAWYKITTPSRYSFVSTCGTDYNSFDTQVSIFSGNCRNLECVAGQDDNCGTNNSEAFVDWESIPGTTYYAVVHGYDNSYGNFTLVFGSY